MGLGFLKDGLQTGFDWATGGLTRIAGEDTLSRIPVLNSITGAQSDSQKALVKKQQQLAAEAEAQRKKNAQMRMQALGQSLLAFNPQNQMMAQMFGPQAAFTPQQFAQMGNDPGAMSPEAMSRAHAESLRTGKPMGVSADDRQRMEENERRKRMIAQQMTPLGPGPAPLQLPPPQAGRRF